MLNASLLPHIVWVVGDDIGWHDLPLTQAGADASTVKSPFLSKLAAEGTVLGNYYVNPICTPTRTSFMTARYPIHVGLQHGVIRDALAEGVPLNETMFPEHLKPLGYKTHIVGKWHLGFYRAAYTPERRGFDDHFGYYTGNTEFWNHTSPAWGCDNYTALDLHRSTATSFAAVTDASDVYSTNLFGDECVRIIEAHPARAPLFLYAPFEAVHGASSCYRRGAPADCETPDGDELQAPQSYIDAQAHIANPFRRTFAAMLGALDEAVGNVTAALDARQMLGRTLLLFTTDNGAPAVHFNFQAMSNWPLRGGKAQLWEGGVRGCGFIWGPGVGVPAGRNSSALIHASDWLPTLLTAIGAPLSPANSSHLDGVDVWASIAHGAPSPRTEILHNIDPLGTTSAAVRVGDFKLIVGQVDAGWGPRPDTGDTAVAAPGETGPWIFNVRTDASERVNLHDSPAHADVRKRLYAALARYNASAVPCRLCYAKPDPAAAPAPLDPPVDVCTPAPVDADDPTKGSRPILCEDVGVWRPWRD